MEILVTGGAGFVGANLCRALVGRGHRVRVLDDLSTGYRSNLVGVPVALKVGSMLDTAVLDRAAEGAGTIVHLAARGSVPRSIADPGRTNEVNVTGSVNVLQAARRHGAQVIVASSSSVYGANPELPKHEGLLPMPMSPYAASKLAVESYSLAFQEVYGLDGLVFRFFNIFGPMQSSRHDYAAVIPSFVAALHDGTALKVYGDGKQSRDFTSVASVTRVLVEAVERRVTHDRPVNLAFGTQTTLVDLIGVLEELTGVVAAVEWCPARVGDVRASRADGTTLRSLFPDVVPLSLRDGLQDTLAWFADTGGRQS